MKPGDFAEFTKLASDTHDWKSDTGQGAITGAKIGLGVGATGGALLGGAIGAFGGTTALIARKNNSRAARAAADAAQKRLIRRWALSGAGYGALALGLRGLLLGTGIGAGVGLIRGLSRNGEEKRE